MNYYDIIAAYYHYNTFMNQMNRKFFLTFNNRQLLFLLFCKKLVFLYATVSQISSLTGFDVFWQSIAELESQLSELREQLVHSNQLRKQQLVELGLLREEEKQKMQHEHESQVQKQ